MKHRLMWVLIGCFLLGVALLACGPAAPRGSEAIPNSSDTANVSPQDPDEAAGRPERTEPRGEETDRPGGNNSGEPEQEPENQVKPTEEPTPTRPPRPTSTPPAAKAPAPGHPDGVAGCKNDRMFDGNEASGAYQGWCQDQLMAQVENQCSSRPDGEQRACGETIAQNIRVISSGTVLPSAWA